MNHLITTAVLAASLSTIVAQPLIEESFDYPNGALTNVAAGIWNWHAGFGGVLTLNVVNGSAFINQPDTSSGGDDYNRSINASFNPATDNTSQIYAGFTVNFSSLPSSDGSYFAHFKSSTSSSEFYSRVGANQEGSGAGTFRLAVANESWNTANTIEYPQDLSLNTTYLVVLRLDLATDQSTLWVNPLDESSQSVSASDPISYAPGVTIDSFALRQGTSGTTGFPGSLYLDNLRVGTTFQTAIPEPHGLFIVGGLLLLLWGIVLRRR